MNVSKAIEFFMFRCYCCDIKYADRPLDGVGATITKQRNGVAVWFRPQPNERFEHVSVTESGGRTS